MAALAGRPKEHDREKLAKELIEWALLPDSINLNGFCCTRKPPIAPSKITLFRNESPIFREAYETAKAFLADRREKMLNNETLHVKAYDLNATTYDYFLKEEKYEEKEQDLKNKLKQLEYEIKLKQDNGSVTEEAMKNLASVMDQLNKLQVRRSEESNRNTTNKSE